MQETAVTLVGMVAGMAVAHACGGQRPVVWLLFCILTALHVFANFKAMRSLQLRSLNRPRLDVLLDAFSNSQSVPSVREVAASEPLLAPPLRTLWTWLTGTSAVQIQLGARLKDLAAGGRQALQGEAAEDWFCWGREGGGVAVLLRPGAHKHQILQSYAVAWECATRSCTSQEAKRRVCTHWHAFLQRLREAGWEANNLALGEGPWKISWGDPGKAD